MENEKTEKITTTIKKTTTSVVRAEELHILKAADSDIESLIMRH